LAENFGAFFPAGGSARAECLSWLFWQMSSAPFLGGGFGHFYAYAPEKIEYAISRYAMETKRQFDVLDRRLRESAYVAGSDYTIADMAIWPWCGQPAQGELYRAGEFLQVREYAHLRRWADQLAARPAFQRGRMVNRTMGEPSSQLHERHHADDFHTRTQDELQATSAAD
jgi:GST-like protein